MYIISLKIVLKNLDGMMKLMKYKNSKSIKVQDSFTNQDLRDIRNFLNWFIGIKRSHKPLAPLLLVFGCYACLGHPGDVFVVKSAILN